MLKRKAWFLVFMAVLVAGFALGSGAIPNWTAPATWTPTRSAGVHTMTDITLMLPFIGVTPCRVADTRGNGFVGQYGPPTLVANATRSFTIAGQCGIPATAEAVSFNFAALNIPGQGDLRVFPAGGGVPLVSTMNYNANSLNIANAAVVPLGSGGAITVQADAVPVDLIIDVNGYYAPIPALSGNYFRIESVVGNGFGAIMGLNDSTAGGTVGVLGEITSSTPGNGSAGVQGINFGTGGEGTGVSGIQTGNGFGVWGEALGTTGQNQRGVFGLAYSSANGTAGVFGSSVASTGKVYGVYGYGTSTAADSAGVLGVDGTGFPAGPLNNESSGVDGYSKLGVAVNGISQVAGVRGLLYDSAGNFLHAGILGITTYGVFSTGDYGGTGAKYFVEPHPTDPGKVVRYISLEGNESGTYFRGSAQIANGMAVISVPEDFRMVTDEEGLTVQLTPVGAGATMYVEKEDLNSIVVRSNRDVKFHYMVNGIRRTFKDFTPIAPEAGEFMPYSPAAAPLSSYPAEIQHRLIANGTYNADGSVNMETSSRLGWDKLKTPRQPVSKVPASQ